MKRLGLAVAVVAVALMVAPAVASADSITAMCTVGQAQAQPCSNGWYTTPVYVSWTWSPLTSGSGSCQAAPYDTDTDKTVSCTVSWTDGFVGTQSYTIHLETSSPTATVAPSRPPDSAGWYNRSVTAAVSAKAFSGIASCTSTTYAGPNSGVATLAATCTDNAGKTVSVTSSPFAYDATPPALTATATPADHSVTLGWQAGGDIAPITAITVVRSPGPAGAAADTVYSGTSSGYQDTSVQDGVAYTYTVSAVDQAGNTSTQTVTATPQARLIAPVNSARLAAPPLLSWTAVLHATYYNVQLYRDGKKILSEWPTKAQLQLRHTWRYHDRRYRLKPGQYRWFVWPGFGKRRAARYGHMIGSWTFVVAR